METVLLKIPDVMQRLGCGRNKVYELISSGELRSMKFGGGRRVPSDELASWRASMTPDRTAGFRCRPVPQHSHTPSTRRRAAVFYLAVSG